MEISCPNCGSKKVKLNTDTKDAFRDVNLAVTGTGYSEPPKMICETCGYTWNPFNNKSINNLLNPDL